MNFRHCIDMLFMIVFTIVEEILSIAPIKCMESIKTASKEYMLAVCFIVHLISNILIDNIFLLFFVLSKK